MAERKRLFEPFSRLFLSPEFVPQTPPPSPTLSEPWRNINWGNKEVDLQYVKEYQPEKEDIKHLRILLYGPVGAAKSSFINSVSSVLRGRMTIPAPVNNSVESDRSFTKKYKTYKIRKGNPKTYYPVVFNDVMGLEEDSDSGVRPEDIKLAMKGHVRENHKFNPVSPLASDDPGYNPEPSADDKVHVLVCVLPANSAEIKESVLKKIADIRGAASDLGRERRRPCAAWTGSAVCLLSALTGLLCEATERLTAWIPQMAIMTNIDGACGETEKNLKNVYKSKHLKKKMRDFSAAVGIPMNCIFPVKNYCEEIDLNDDVDSLILSALRRMIDFGDDFIDQM